jgi:hypothetical protein
VSISQIIIASSNDSGPGGPPPYYGEGPSPGTGSYQYTWSGSENWSPQGTPYDPGSGTSDVTNPQGGWIRRTYSGIWSPEGVASNSNPGLFSGGYNYQTSDSYAGFGSTAVGDWYAMEWKGYFRPPTTATYNFLADSDDICMFWIGNGALNPESYGPLCTSANGNNLNQNSVILDATLWYPVRMRYQEWAGGERCQVYAGPVNSSSPLNAMMAYSSGMCWNGNTAGY